MEGGGPATTPRNLTACSRTRHKTHVRWIDEERWGRGIGKVRGSDRRAGGKVVDPWYEMGFRNRSRRSQNVTRDIHNEKSEKRQAGASGKGGSVLGDPGGGGYQSTSADGERESSD
jgi:hypothetical protein